MKKWILDLTGRDGAQTTQKVYMCTDWIRTKYVSICPLPIILNLQQ